MDVLASVVFFESDGVGSGISNSKPEPVGLRWFYAGGANRVDKQPTDSQCLISQHFSVESITRASGQQAIFRIGCKRF